MNMAEIERTAIDGDAMDLDQGRMSSPNTSQLVHGHPRFESLIIKEEEARHLYLLACPDEILLNICSFIHEPWYLRVMQKHETMPDEESLDTNLRRVAYTWNDQGAIPVDPNTIWGPIRCCKRLSGMARHSFYAKFVQVLCIERSISRWQLEPFLNLKFLQNNIRVAAIDWDANKPCLHIRSRWVPPGTVSDRLPPLIEWLIRQGVERIELCTTIVPTVDTFQQLLFDAPILDRFRINAAWIADLASLSGIKTAAIVSGWKRSAWSIKTPSIWVTESYDVFMDPQRGIPLFEQYFNDAQLTTPASWGDHADAQLRWLM